LSPPFLDFFFSRYRAIHVRRFFEVNELIDVILLGESFDQFVFVFIETPHDIVSHSNVHDPVIPVGHQVDVIAFFSGHYVSLREEERFLPPVEMTEKGAVMTTVEKLPTGPFRTNVRNLPT
jgi:hypothetical protein